MLTEIDFLQMPLIAKLKWLRDNTTIEKLTYFYANSTEVVACDVIDLRELIRLFGKFSIEDTFIMEYQLDNVDEKDPRMVRAIEMLDALRLLLHSEDQNEKIFHHITITWLKEDPSSARLEESVECSLMAHLEKMLWRMKENVGIMLKV